MKQAFNILYFFTASTLFLSLGLSGTASAQAPSIGPDGWKPLYSDQSTAVFYRYADCSSPSTGISQQDVLLRFSNLTSAPLKIQWKNELVYGTKCFNCDGTNSELSYEIVLQPNEVKSGACEDERKTLKIFSRFLNSSDPATTLTNFKIKDVTSTQVN